MSAEGKKKRGESGRSNAANIAFRYGGSKCDYSLGRRVATSTHPRWAGSLLVRAFALSFAVKDKYPFPMTTALATHVDAAMANCTHPDLTAA